MDALKKLAEETARKRKALNEKGLKVRIRKYTYSVGGWAGVSGAPYLESY